MKVVFTLADLEKMKLAEKSREHFYRGAHLIWNCDGGCRQRDVQTDESRSQVLRIMTLSRLMSDCSQRDSRKFADPANRLAAQPVYPESRQDFAGLFSVIQIASNLNAGSTGLRGEQSLNPLRT